MRRIAIAAVAVLTSLALSGAALAVPPAAKNFNAVASGDQEVTVGFTIDTHARGVGIFKLSADGQSVSYKVIASNIDNVIMSHIHLAPAGTNGDIVVWLYPTTSPPPAPPAGGRHDGILAQGTFTAANLTGPLAGQALSALLDAMRAGNTYLNIHTDDGVAPPNTGPGDFPPGEIRGQIKANGPGE